MSIRFLSVCLLLFACQPRLIPVPTPSQPAVAQPLPNRDTEWLTRDAPQSFTVKKGETITLRFIHAGDGTRDIEWKTDAVLKWTTTSSEGSQPLVRPAPFGFWGTGRPVRTVFQTFPEVSPVTAGDSETFWINNGSGQLSGDRPSLAHRRHVTPHAYFYVDEQESRLDSGALERMAEAFEQRIRPGITAVFGTEAQPGIDGDARLFVVISPWVGSAPGHQGMLGYFWYRDAIARIADPAHLAHHSNEKEVLFLSSRLVEERAVTAFGTLAHEYQHLIGFTLKRLTTGREQPEVPWLDEGLSMVAMDLAGYGTVGGDPFVQQDIDAYRQRPAAYSLTEWAENPGGYGYGLSYLFIRHLVQRHGLGVIKDLMQEPERGQVGLERVLQHYGTDLASSFIDWAIAADDPLVGIPLATESPTGTVTMRPWSQLVVTLTASRDAERPLLVSAREQAVRVVIERSPQGRSDGQTGLSGHSIVRDIKF